MGRIILVTGGSRSGKSECARKLAETLPAPRVYVATCPVVDEEMLTRIRRHQTARRQAGWITIEEQVNLCNALNDCAESPTILVDCLTLWVSNLMSQAEGGLSEDDMANSAESVVAAAREHEGTVIFVTNEVGMGIVPENALARRFRDLAGRGNQVMAHHADSVVLTVCGIPLRVKGKDPDELVGRDN